VLAKRVSQRQRTEPVRKGAKEPGHGGPALLFAMATAIIPSLLRKFTNGEERVTARGRNVRELIADLNRQFPGLADQLMEGDDLKPSSAVSVDGEIGPGGIMEPVGESSEVHFLPAIGGGSD
jgi:sulfur-carrier protein